MFGHVAVSVCRVVRSASNRGWVWMSGHVRLRDRVRLTQPFELHETYWWWMDGWVGLSYCIPFAAMFLSVSSTSNSGQLPGPL